MKNLVALLMILAFLGRASTCFSEETVVMAAEEWAPLISKDFKHKGVLARIVIEAFALEGVKVDVEWGVPWKRGYKGVQSGQYDISPGWAKSPERVQEVIFSDPIFKSHRVFYHRKTFPFQWKSLDDLKGLRVGGVIGYYYGADFEQAEKDGKLTVERVSTDELNFKKLAAGRIQVFPVNSLVGQYISRKVLNPEQNSFLVSHAKRLSESEHYVVFEKSEKGARLVRIFNKGFKRLKDSGIVDRYFVLSQRGEYD